MEIRAMSNRPELPAMPPRFRFSANPSPISRLGVFATAPLGPLEVKFACRILGLVGGGRGAVGAGGVAARGGFVIEGALPPGE